MKYAYYPGCSLESTAWDFDKSTRAVCRALDIELKEIPDWVCCGSTPGHATNPYLALALPAANLVKAQEMDLPVLTACASCYARLRTANFKIKNSSVDRELNDKVSGFSYDGSVPALHILDVLVNQYGIDKIEKRISNPLTGIKVASYYGCLLSRPPEVVAFDDPEHPACMDDIVSAAGATPVDWPYKTECCGGSLSLSNTKVVSRLSHKLISMVNRAGAECMVVACPLCHINVDMRQSDAKAFGTLEKTPVLYITQLLGLALGMSPKELGIGASFIDATGIVKKIRKNTTAKTGVA